MENKQAIDKVIRDLDLSSEPVGELGWTSIEGMNRYEWQMRLTNGVTGATLDIPWYDKPELSETSQILDVLVNDAALVDCGAGTLESYTEAVTRPADERTPLYYADTVDQTRRFADFLGGTDRLRALLPAPTQVAEEPPTVAPPRLSDLL